MNNLYKPYQFGDVGVTLEQALKENPYNPQRGNESAYCRYLRYRVKGFYTKTSKEVRTLWKGADMSLREEMWKYEQITGESAEHVPIIKLGAFLDGYETAIKAQKKQPCEDCISREAVKEMLRKEWTKYMPMELDINLSFVLEKISDLSSVTPKPRWIPCSERLPEDYIHVLCQFTLGGMGECYLAHGVFHVVGGLVMTCNEVIAWMPLPEPYKAESEEEE